MISSIAWVPRGVADPNPKKYKLSKAESQFLEQVGQNRIDESNIKLSTSDDIQEEEIDPHSAESGTGDENNSENLEEYQREENIQRLIQALPTLDPSTLPAELRMDEYSDNDEDGDDNQHNHRIGQVLLGSYGTDLKNHQDMEDFKADDDDDEDDSLEDVPDTREFIPTDVKGLEAMRFSGYTGMADYEDNMEEDDAMDDDSDIDDTNLRPDDALILVAKTDEVCFLHSIISFNLFVFLSSLILIQFLAGLCNFRNTCV